MKQRTLAILIFLFILFDLGLFWVVSNWKNLTTFPSIISSFYSKEFCSCYYVVREDEDFCHNYARQWVPISDFKLDRETKTVTVSGLGRTNSSRFVSPEFGCKHLDLD
jgi:Ni/Fe-hydrogenase subunit HybB-like protein